MTQVLKKESLLPFIALFIFIILYFINIQIEYAIMNHNRFYDETPAIFQNEDLFYLTFQGGFVFLTAYLFLKQFGTFQLTLKNIGFTCLLPFIYLLSQRLITLILGAAFHFATKDNSNSPLGTAISYINDYFLLLLSLILFFILSNFLVALFFKKEKKEQYLSCNNVIISFFIALAIVVTTGIAFDNITPVNQNFLLNTINFNRMDNIFFTEIPLHKHLFSIAFTLTFVIYFYFWGKEQIASLQELHLDTILSLIIKLSFIFLLFFMIWDLLQDGIFAWGENHFINDLYNPLKPISLLSYTTNAGISMMLILISLLLMIFIAKMISNKTYQVFHFTMIIALVLYISIDSFHPEIPLRLLLFQNALFFLTLTATIAVLGSLYQFLISKIPHKLSAA